MSFYSASLSNYPAAVITHTPANLNKFPKVLRHHQDFLSFPVQKITTYSIFLISMWQTHYNTDVVKLLNVPLALVSIWVDFELLDRSAHSSNTPSAPLLWPLSPNNVILRHLSNYTLWLNEAVAQWRWHEDVSVTYDCLFLVFHLFVPAVLRGIPFLPAKCFSVIAMLAAMWRKHCSPSNSFILHLCGGSTWWSSYQSSNLIITNTTFSDLICDYTLTRMGPPPTVVYI